MKLNKIIIISLFIISGFYIFCSEDVNNTVSEVDYNTLLQKRITQIVSNPEYIVTPGDVYNLEFIMPAASDETIMSFFIEGDYTINLSFLGKHNVKSFSYTELKDKVEEIVKNEFPKSFPQVTISKPGEFSVVVKGEVNRCREIKAWGFTKLSSIFSQVKTDYSSSMQVEIVSVDSGENKFYNLSSANYFGQLDQDPYVKKGDTIVLHKKYGSISVSGQVYRPGSYEFFEGESLNYILDTLCKGFLPLADVSRIQVKRYISSEHKYGETIYLSHEDIEGFTVNPMDQIIIPKISDYQPKVYFQGAVGTNDVSNKIPVTITAGDKLSFVARRLKEKFTLSSDIENAILTREGVGESLQVDLQELLDTEDPDTDVILKDGDIIVIPFRQYKVYVSGQVTNPGAYPYIANRTWEYYVGLAGGFNMENHIGKKVKIRDVYGEKFKQDERIIQPEDVIYSPLNHPMYYLREYGTDVAVISTAIIGTAALIWKLDQIASGNAGDILSEDTSTNDSEKSFNLSF